MFQYCQKNWMIEQPQQLLLEPKRYLLDLKDDIPELKITRRKARRAARALALNMFVIVYVRIYICRYICMPRHAYASLGIPRDA